MRINESKLVLFKYVLVGVGFVGLLGWNANLQKRLADEHDEGNSNAREDHTGRARRKRDANSANSQAPTGGAMFVRWGRRDCLDESSELVYSGIVGSSIYTEIGGSAELICLARDPIYGKYDDSVQGSAKIGGMQYGDGGGSNDIFDTSNAPSGSITDADMVCSVCRSKVHASQVMIPGRKECYHGWRKEYWGYLMTSHYSNKAQHSWTCVDNTPEGDEKGSKHDVNSGRVYLVEGVCGSLPCPNYVGGREVTCVVCTK